MSQLPLQCTVRYTAGAYVTNTVKGQRASSTRDAKTAVESLAAKLLPNSEWVVASHPSDAKLWVILPRDWQPPAGTLYVELEFEDHGQDFLTWRVEPTTGFVFDCGPFQGSFWCGNLLACHVINVRHGDVLSLVKTDRLHTDHAVYAVKYPIAQIRHGEV